MMRAARTGADRGAIEAGLPAPLVIAVTVLSSQSGEGLASAASLAFEAKSSGLDGVVVSGEDVQDVRAVCGDGFCLVVPGIRPAGGNGHDQVRVLTPAARSSTAPTTSSWVARSPPRRIRSGSRARSSARLADAERTRPRCRIRWQCSMFALCPRSRGCVYSPGSDPCPKQRSA
jgi:hypothetical protein